MNRQFSTIADTSRHHCHRGIPVLFSRIAGFHCLRRRCFPVKLIYRRLLFVTRIALTIITSHIHCCRSLDASSLSVSVKILQMLSVVLWFPTGLVSQSEVAERRHSFCFVDRFRIMFVLFSDFTVLRDSRIFLL